MPLKPKSAPENMLIEYKPCLAHHKHTLKTKLMPKHKASKCPCLTLKYPSRQMVNATVRLLR